MATIFSMKSVGIKLLNNRLSEFVRLAAAGETILITDGDRVVAELGPSREKRSPKLEDTFLADAVRNGLLSPPTIVDKSPPPAPPPFYPLEKILEHLDEDRSDR